ncbi:MAG: substrate-binding domain-containing protein, partial [Kiritimatiellae bacterium]|nr:substrate-binding domain-containing protein [Kiritimatiellia bacterium]
LVWSRIAGKEIDNWKAQYNWLQKELRRLPKPLAVFCYCDYDAAKFESVCLDAGYNVPEDIAILGVDNDTLVCENIRVPLSSVRHDLVRIGYEGAALLNQIMGGAKPPREPGLVPPRGVELRASTDSATHADPLVRAAMHYFRDNLGKSIGVSDVAAAMGIPRHKLVQHFDKITGKPVYSTLLRLRLLEVKRLLALTDQSIKDIAKATGFCHAQHLSNVFSRTEGITPLNYRRIEHKNSSLH